METSEKQVSQYLDKLKIKHIYEQPVFVWDEKDRPRTWTPDFYLPDLSVYVEVCGSKDFDYKYRQKIYEKNGLYVIFIHWYKDSNKWKLHFKEKLKEFSVFRHKKVTETIKLFFIDHLEKMEAIRKEMKENEWHMCIECGDICKGNYEYCPSCGFPIL